MNYENHVFIDKAFENKKLKGQVLCNVVYLRRGDEIWSVLEKAKFMATLHQMLTLFEEEAAAEHIDLRFVVNSSELDCDPLLHGYSYMLEKNLAKANGCDTVKQYVNYSKLVYSADDMFQVFVRKDSIWECAAPNVDAGAIFVCLSSRATTLLHETLHLYGAKDLYLPAFKDLVEHCFPDSGMNTFLKLGSHSIDSLSRFLIGWHKQPDETARYFLEQTKDITIAQFEAARRMKAHNMKTYYLLNKPYFSVEALQKAAVSKDPLALYLLGYCYEHGIYLPQNLQMAAQCYGESFIGSYACAGYALANMILSKKFPAESEKIAVSRILSTFQKTPHHICGVSLYACCLLFGFGFTSKRSEEALSIVTSNYNFYNFANFDTDKQFQKLPMTIQQHKLLEKLCRNLPELHQSIKKDFDYYAEIERNGDPVLFYLMGHFLENGHPQPNPEQAFALYLKAAQQNLSVACKAVANCFSKGIGASVDPISARFWEERAVQTRLEEDNNPNTRLQTRILNNTVAQIYSNHDCKPLPLPRLLQVTFHCPQKVL